MPDETQTEDCVLAADRGAIRVLTLNRPATRNAIDLELRVVLAEALEAPMADEAVRAVVLTGAAGTFCSGGDVSTMRRQPADGNRARIQAAQRVVRAIWNGPKPVLAAVEGYAAGAGASPSSAAGEPQPGVTAAAAEPGPRCPARPGQLF
jgi:enoyl-CoA hydratase/carnithine racemase